MADLSNKAIRFPRPLKRVTVNWCGAPAVSAAEAAEAERAALEKGRFEVRQEMTDQVTALRDALSQQQDAVLKSVQRSHEELLASIAQRLPRLVVKAASKVLEGLELDADQVEGVVAKILSAAPEGERIELRMNPDDLQLLRGVEQAEQTQAAPDPDASGEDFAQALSGLFGGGGTDSLAEKYPDVDFSEDETLGRGECMMHSRYGVVDGRVATKLAAIEESMGGAS